MLNKKFYLKDAVTVARRLVGKLLVREIEEKKVVCRIVETEAYCGPEDKGSHAYQNRKTDRTKVMFAAGGCAYVYLIYGMYHCFNVVCAPRGKPEAVLIRAGEPLSGQKIIEKNRKIKNQNPKNLTNGPGKLCQALKIDKKFNGYSLFKGEKLYIQDSGSSKEIKIAAGKRINIDYAEEYKHKPWRFYIKGNPYLS
ncbi:MAG: DNA-3-methyladenine glycosylase [Halanaerobiaceae bacterium]